MTGNLTFGQWVKRRRKELDLTQQELAQRMNYAPVSIQKIETGERQPSKELVELLIEHLQIPENQRRRFGMEARTQTPIPGEPRIPESLTALVGREADLDKARSRLMRGDTRLLTLVGPPGIGKTELGLQLAREVRSDFEDDPPYVDLTLVKDASQVAGAIAAKLQIKAVGDTETQLKQYLADKRLLLLLDNFEHVREAAALVAELLRACPHLKILVTSRAPLKISGEKLFKVEPLALPDPQEDYGRDVLLSFPAAALFCERAQSANPEFSLNEDTIEAVVEICRRLEGIPLAIELAAARLNLFNARALLKRLDRRLGPIMEVGTRRKSPHQQTLRGTLEWSYNLLDAEEQALFARMAVFVGGCTFEAVEQVCAADGLNVLRTLDSLIDNSLVRQVTGPGGEPRYTVLETIRELMQEKLAQRGEVETLYDQHARCYAALAEAAEPYLRGREQMLWLARLEADHHNLRAALAWSLEHEPALNLRLASALGWFWWLNAHLTEARGWLTAALDKNRGAGAAMRVKALRYCLPTAIGLGDCDWGIRIGEEALRLCQQLHDRKMQAETLMCLSLCWNAAGDSARAAQASKEALAIAQEMGDLPTMTTVLFQMGLSHPDSAQSLSFIEKSQQLAREAGQQWRTLVSMQVLIQAQTRDKLTQQGQLLDDILTLCREIGDRRSSALIGSYQAEFAQHRGDFERASRLLREALTLSWELYDRPVVIIHLVHFASLAGSQGQWERAARLLAAAAAAIVKTGVGLFPGDQNDFDGIHAHIHSQMSDAAFAAAWHEGRLMPLEQAVNYALRHEAELPQQI